jgi:hypothetical protein
MTPSEKLLADFELAYAAADVFLTQACTGTIFSWYQHLGNTPEGKTIVGVEAVCEEIRWRQQNWKNVKYENVVNYFQASLITSTFLISGQNEKGDFFKVRAVDLYPVKNNRIASKDTYWKQMT